MDRFGHSAFKDELKGVQIHRLSNIMTMDYFYHMHFNKLNLWFEAVLVSQTVICEIICSLHFTGTSSHLPHLRPQRSDTRSSCVCDIQLSLCRLGPSGSPISQDACSSCSRSALVGGGGIHRRYSGRSRRRADTGNVRGWFISTPS
jgi:hypothetical protein